MASGCSNTNASSVSIFNFPQNEEVRSQVDYRCRKREPNGQLLQVLLLCCDRFEESCLEPLQKVAAQWNWNVKSTLVCCRSIHTS